MNTALECLSTRTPSATALHGSVALPLERRSVRSVFVGRDFLTDLVKLYADSD